LLQGFHFCGEFGVLRFEGCESGGFGFQSSILRCERIDLFCQFLRGANIEHRDGMAHCQDIWDGGILALTAQPLLNPYFALACKISF
jgi:hypothetical protein